MSDTYTPDESELRDAHIIFMRIVNEMSGRADDAARSGEEFDRAVAKIKADAWGEGLGAGCDRWMDSREFGDPPVNPYREDEA